MTITYDWSIVQIDYNNDEDKGVVTAHWRVTATDDENTVSSYGSTSHQPDPSLDSFVDFESLTEATVLSWVFDQINQEQVEYELSDQLSALGNPTVLSGLPWATEPVSDEE